MSDIRIDLLAPSLVVCGDSAKAKEIAHRLASGIWTHDFPITVETAKKLIGLPISTEIPGEVFLVTSLYPQAQQSQPSVFYLPGPRYKKGEPAGQEAALR